jgi:hypothetical protein
VDGYIAGWSSAGNEKDRTAEELGAAGEKIQKHRTELLKILDLQPYQAGALYKK